MATLLTIVGQRKFLEAEVTGKKVEFAEYALGDGIGVTEGQTSLTSEKFRHPINDLKVVEGGILIECHVPKEAEGFTIREVGVYDAKGDLIVVSDYPETDRLVTEEADTLIIQAIVGISNTESATINVDASELMASQQSVNLALEESKRYTDAKVGDVDFSEIEGKIKKLETEDKRLHVLIAENTEALQAIDAEVLREQGELARVKGNLAEASADKADRASERANEVASELESYGHVGKWQVGSYKKNQEVLHEGSTYRAMEDTEEEPPSDDWQLIARKGVDGTGSVVTVNGKSPDEDGNVELDELASKEYVDDKIGDVDLSALETKEDATEKFEKVKQSLKEHESLQGSFSDSGHVTLSNHTESSSSVSDGVAATPLAVKTVNDRISNLSSEDINAINPIDLTESAAAYPLGVTVFYKNVAGDGAPSQYGNVLTLKGATATTFQLFAKNGFIRQSEEIHFRIHHTTKGWTDWFKLMDSHDLSDSTTSDSSETIATSRAVKKAYDRADEAFTLGVKQKQATVDSLTSIGASLPSDPSWDELQKGIKEADYVKEADIVLNKDQTTVYVDFVPKFIGGGVPEGNKGDVIYIYYNIFTGFSVIKNNKKLGSVTFQDGRVVFPAGITEMLHLKIVGVAKNDS